MLANLSTAALALVAASLVSAQTSTDCNPLKKDCPPDPAVGKNGINCDFTKGQCNDFTSLGTKIEYGDQGAVFAMKKVGDAPTLRSNKYIFFGRVEIEMQSAPGAGIITSLVLLSDDLDEIDYETVGADDKQIQSNYFSKGDDSTYNRGAFHAIDNPFTVSHNYAFEWTADKTDWYINGALVRTLKAADVGAKYPQSPMQIKIGSWVAGYEGNSNGTIEWAGGIADFSHGSIKAYYKTVKVIDYAGGSSATTKNIKEYVFGDRSGLASSIQIKEGNGQEDDDKSGKDKTGKDKTGDEKSAESTTTTTDDSTTSTSVTTKGVSTTAHSIKPSTSLPSPLPKSSKVANPASRVQMAVGAVAFGAIVALAL